MSSGLWQLTDNTCKNVKYWILRLKYDAMVILKCNGICGMIWTWYGMIWYGGEMHQVDSSQNWIELNTVKWH